MKSYLIQFDFNYIGGKNQLRIVHAINYEEAIIKLKLKEENKSYDDSSDKTRLLHIVNLTIE